MCSHRCNVTTLKHETLNYQACLRRHGALLPVYSRFIGENRIYEGFIWQFGEKTRVNWDRYINWTTSISRMGMPAGVFSNGNLKSVPVMCDICSSLLFSLLLFPLLTHQLDDIYIILSPSYTNFISYTCINVNSFLFNPECQEIFCEILQ